MELTIASGVSALQVADLGIKVVSDSDRDLNGICGGDLDAALGLNIVRASLAIRALDAVFRDPIRKDLWKHDAFRTTQAITDTCWCLFLEVEASLNGVLEEPSLWPLVQWGFEVLSAKAQCLKDALKVLRAVLEIPREDTHMPKRGSAAGMAPHKAMGTTGGARPITSTSAICTFHYKPQSPIVCQRQDFDRVQEEEQTSPEVSETGLDQCASHVKGLLHQIEGLRKYGGSQSPRELAAEYTRIRRDLDGLILDEEEEKAASPRRQSFQMTPVKAYLRRAKYSWKDWIMLSPISKSKREDFAIPELHAGNECPFPGCQAHEKPSKESPRSEMPKGEIVHSEKRTFELPEGMPSHIIPFPEEEMHPSARFLGQTPGPQPNLSITTIYTEDDDSSSCHSCSSAESASSFWVVNEGCSKMQSPSLANAPSSSASAALPECLLKMPKSAHDALRLWTTLLD
ncbi:hypothetical protein MPH_07716 [Macrophomina phaseolina MS6]|uniref:Uncharacterized protein n=1 Tax=Macrophomina phaseolina (strain MS6) TaxID=1126212 RepID=K2RK74_MACPH|nr:hypothetical protein MPH_07716 [Macrophomina phaseolina MS6]